MSCPLRLSSLLTAALLASACASHLPAPSVSAAWAQLGPDNRLSVRAIVPEGSSCPAAEIDGQPQALALRAAPNPNAPSAGNPAFQPTFKVQSCELNLETTPGKVVVATRTLPLPKAGYRRIAVVGDTGCRIKMPADGKGDPIQDCADPEAWPWARIAAAAAAKEPELVIHVGDYHYREYCDEPARCAPLKQAGVVIDYGWPGWEADFFTPAAPLLHAAPWVFVRGNHENCDRGGEGWRRFLAPGPYRACTDSLYKSPSRSVPGNNGTEPGYRVDIDTGLSLFVADSAGSEDYRLASEAGTDTEILQTALSGLRDMPGDRRVWLVSHKALWYDLLDPKRQPNAWQSAVRRTLNGRVDLTVSGHEHAFQTLNFPADADPGYPGGRPAQVIVGGGGTQLDDIDPHSPAGHSYEGLPAAYGMVLKRFSFLLLEKAGDNWNGTVYDPDGRPLSLCQWRPGTKSLDCQPPR